MLKYISMHIKSQLEYKSSFIFLCISQLFAFLMYYITFTSLFEKFGMVKSFNIYQVMICFAIAQFGESFGSATFRGFDKFSDVIKNGDFDILLIRPQNIYYQIIGTKVELAKVVKSSFSVILIIYAMLKLNISFKFIPVILLMLICSTVVFVSMFILTAAMCFKTIEGLEVMNILIYGTRDFGQYPIGMYNNVVKTFFTYIIPIGLTTYFPMLYITGVSSNIFYAFVPIFAFLLLIPSCLLFNLGVKKYKSTGS